MGHGLDEATRLEKLRELEAQLFDALSRANSRSMASLARQYRETLAEIDELEADDGDDGIAELIGGKG